MRRYIRQWVGLPWYTKASVVVALAAAVVLAWASFTAGAGCGPVAEASSYAPAVGDGGYGDFGEMPDGTERFAVEYTGVPRLSVLIDRMTGCQYIIGVGEWAVPLLDSDGSPILTGGR